MRKDPIRASILTLACIVIAASCTSSNSKHPGDPSGGPGTYVMRVDEVNSGGCFNLERAIHRMRSFPGLTEARFYTSDIQILSSHNRAGFHNTLYVGNYFFREGSFSEVFQRVFKESDIRQPNCQTVAKFTDTANVEDWQVVESSPAHLKIAFGENRIETYRHLDSQTLQIEKEFTSQKDNCDTKNGAKIIVRTIFKWGGGEITSRTEELASSSLISKLEAIVASPGEEVADPTPMVEMTPAPSPAVGELPTSGSTPSGYFISMSESDLVSVSVSELRRLAGRQIDPIYQHCSPPHVKASPVPNPSAGPSPEFEEDDSWGDGPRPTPTETPE